MKRALLCACAAVLLSSWHCPAFADDDSATLLTFGAAAEWGINHGGSAYGPSASVQFTPFDGWLEIEAGTSPLFSHGQTEWQTGLSLQIPFDPAPDLELDFGVGPQWSHLSGGDEKKDSYAMEASLEAIWFPFHESRIGLFVEPAYGYDFSAEHEQSIGVTAGIAIAL